MNITTATATAATTGHKALLASNQTSAEFATLQELLARDGYKLESDAKIANNVSAKTIMLAKSLMIIRKNDREKGTTTVVIFQAGEPITITASWKVFLGNALWSDLVSKEVLQQTNIDYTKKGRPRLH